MYELVQQELAKNAQHGSGRSNASCFSGKIRCAACDEYFSPKTWHSNDPYKKRVWQCNGKYRERRLDHCQTPHLSEEQLQAAFVCAFNEVCERVCAKYTQQFMPPTGSGTSPRWSLPLPC
jgi:hypothetical protein